MELEDMKATWEELSNRVEKQEILTNQMIEKMTQQKINSNLNKIGYSEYAGTLVCYLGAAYLSVNFTKIEEPIMQLFGAVSIALLLLLPIISLQSVRAIKRVNIASKTYVETIRTFALQKIKFQKLQKLNVSLGLLLMLITVPVLSAIQGKDLSQISNFWTVIFPFFVLFFLAFAYWVLRYYNKALKEAERMLAEINS
jgi:hypothetical protein